MSQSTQGGGSPPVSNPSVTLNSIRFVGHLLIAYCGHRLGQMLGIHGEWSWSQVDGRSHTGETSLPEGVPPHPQDSNAFPGKWEDGKGLNEQ